MIDLETLFRETATDKPKNSEIDGDREKESDRERERQTDRDRQSDKERARK